MASIQEHGFIQGIADPGKVSGGIVKLRYIHPFFTQHAGIGRHGGVIAVAQGHHDTGLAVFQLLHGQIGEIGRHHAVQTIRGPARII